MDIGVNFLLKINIHTCMSLISTTPFVSEADHFRWFISKALQPVNADVSTVKANDPRHILHDYIYKLMQNAKHSFEVGAISSSSVSRHPTETGFII